MKYNILVAYVKNPLNSAHKKSIIRGIFIRGVKTGNSDMPRTNHKTKSQTIHQKLKDDILSGKYKPHQRIILSDIANKFSSSEIPVREAIRHLSAEGIVVNTPYVGAVVTSIDLQDIVKLYDIRKVIEGMAVRMAAENVTPKKIDQLEHTIKMIQKKFEEQKYESVGLLYKKFYSIIYSACENEYLYKIIFDLWDLSFRSPGILAGIRTRTQQSIKGLKKIVRALKKSDSELVEKLMIRQKEDALAAWIKFYKKTNPV